jgi:hypothetical protein
LRKIAKRPKRPAAEVKKLEKELEERGKTTIKNEEHEADQLVADGQRRVHAAELSGNKTAVLDAKAALVVTEKEAESRKKAIHNRFKVDAFFRKDLEALPSDLIYTFKDYDKVIWVVINTNSVFYQEIYEAATQHAEMQSLLDLMIFSLAHSEANEYNSAKMKEFWAEARVLISRFAGIFVPTIRYGRESEREAPDTFRTKHEVAKDIAHKLEIKAPDEKKGSTIATTWYRKCAEALEVNLEAVANKHDIFDSMLEHYGIPINPKYKSGGSTITQDGLIILDEIADLWQTDQLNKDENGGDS